VPLLKPFRALRYGVAAGPLAGLLAPPYDVIDAAEAEELRARSPWNAVRLVLPEGDPPERYRLAAERLEEWTGGRILQRDATAAVTVYRQDFDAPEGPLSRHALFAALRLEPLGEGVLPHERTHSGPKQDRLALTLATSTQLSPIFLAARDEDGGLLSALRTAIEPAEGPVRTPDGIRHTVRAIDDAAATTDLCALGASGPLLVADGHHRYETALEVARRVAGDLPGSRFVMVCVVSERDPGLRIRATHRVVRDPAPAGEGGGWVSRLQTGFRVHELPRLSAVDAADRAARSGRIVLRAGGVVREIEPRPGALAAAGLDEADTAVPAVPLDRLVIEALLGRDADAAARDGLLSYHRDAAEAWDAATRPGAAAFLLPPVSLEAVRRATELGRRLPPKSTYFEPKIPSGLLFRPLDGG
jgi:uncharacterized protein (DUF1015 family)